MCALYKVSAETGYIEFSRSIPKHTKSLDGTVSKDRKFSDQHSAYDIEKGVNTWLFLVGIVVFLFMSLLNTPPSVSIPSDSGVTSNNRTSVTSPASTPPYRDKQIAFNTTQFRYFLERFTTKPYI